MTVDVPKNGASRRVAAISAPSVLRPTAKTSASSGRRRPRSAPRDSRAVTRLNLAFERREVRLARPADRAIPVRRDVLEGGALVDPAVGVAFLRVVDEAAGFADPLPVRVRAHAGAY